MPLFIHQIGTGVPEAWLDARGSAELLARGCRDKRAAKLLARISGLTQIRKRHLAGTVRYHPDPAQNTLYQNPEFQPDGPGMLARSLAFEQEAMPVVSRALATLDRAALEQVRTLITVSCTHASSPGLERPVFAQAPVPRAVDRWNLGFMGCSAGLAALRLLHNSAAEARAALVLACEMSSLHFQYSDKLDQLTANVLFADGAAALLTSTDPGPVAILDAACVATPQFAEQMIWIAGDHGLRLSLSQELPDTIAATLPAAMDDFLNRSGLARKDIKHWLVHPGGPQILDAVETSLALSKNSLGYSRHILSEFGNMSSPTIFFILKHALEQGARGSAVAIAFGPGLTIEMILMEL